MKNRNIEGIILSRKNFGEADRLILMFSRELGKIKVVARGSRKLKSKMACFLEPYTIGKYHLITGKSNYILAGAESVWCSLDTASNADSYEILSYISEIIEMTTEEAHEESRLYGEIAGIFRRVEGLPREYFLLLKVIAEIKLLYYLGYMPEIKYCILCKLPLSTQPSFAGDINGIYCGKCRGGNDIEINVLKAINYIKDNELDSILRVKDIRKIASKIDHVINPLLYDILPRKPRSLEIWNQKN